MRFPRAFAALVLALAPVLGACAPPGDLAFVRHRGADLPVLVQGQVASKKLLVFIHGGPGGTGVTRHASAAFQALGQDVAIASYDQRLAGLAQGDPDAGSLGLVQHVEDLDLVVELLRQRHPGARLYLLGHSWGGAVATAYLAEPSRQAKIAGWLPTSAAYDMKATLAQSRAWAIARAEARLAEGKDVVTAQAALAWYAERPILTGAALVGHFTYLTKLGAYLHDPARADKLDAARLLFFGPYSLPSEALNLAETFRRQDLDELAGLDLRDRLPAITLPTLVMGGRHDGSVPIAAAEAMYAALGTPARDKALTIFEGSAHRPMDDEPAAFAAAVRAFLARH